MAKKLWTPKHGSYQIWQNVLVTAASLSPPDWASVLSAQRRVIELRGDTVGEACIDTEILEHLIQHIITTTDTYDPAKPGIVRMTVKLIDEVAKSRAAGVLVIIDSPGGTTTGSERIYDALRRLSAKKPTVAVVGTLAASGAYIAAIGTDHIVAQGNSLVGSIGVLFEFPNVADALNKIGVKGETMIYEVRVSAPVK